MKIAGGIISLVFAVLAVGGLLFTLVVGGVGGAFGVEEAETVVGLGWAGLFISFVIIVFAAASIAAKSKVPSVMVITLSLINVIARGSVVAIIMVPTLLGGILEW